MLGQQQLHVGTTRLAGLGAVGVDHHAVEHVVVAGGNQLVAALDLDHAHAAAADLVQIAQVAQGGNLDADGLGRVQDRVCSGTTTSQLSIVSLTILCAPFSLLSLSVVLLGSTIPGSSLRGTH